MKKILFVGAVLVTMFPILALAQNYTNDVEDGPQIVAESIPPAIDSKPQEETGSAPVVMPWAGNKSRTMSSWEEARKAREALIEKRKDCMDGAEDDCSRLISPIPQETMMLNQENRQEERQVTFEEQKQKTEERKTEIKARVTEKLAEAFGKTFENFKKFSLKLSENSLKLEERIGEFETKGRDLSSAKKQLEDAKTLINALPLTIENAEAKVTALLTGENPKTKVSEIRKVLNETKQQVREAHESFVKAIAAVKNNIKVENSGDQDEGETN